MSFQGGKNLHVLSMIFYMILNELITRFSHFELISGIASKGNIIFEVIQDFDFIELKIKGAPVKITDEFFSTKLINHLFSIESLQVISDEQRIKILNSKGAGLESLS